MSKNMQLARPQTTDVKNIGMIITKA